MPTLALENAARLTRELFPPGVAVAARDTRADAPPLWLIEASAVAAAIPRRRVEFAAGRAAARDALAALGLPDAAIPMGEDRAPIWPEGVAGSLTHTDDVALAVLAPLGIIRALGLDAEPDEPLPGDVTDTICRVEERRWLNTMPDRARWARLIFAAKEAAYKCQFPLSRTIFGHDCISITADIDTGGLTARFMVPVAPFKTGARLQGRFVMGAGMILAGFTLVG